MTVFGPDPLLSVTIERRGADDDVHLHAAGQGVWVARMAAEMGADPVLCCMLGGETGALIERMLQAMPLTVRAVATGGPNGSFVTDRRLGARNVLAISNRPAPHRHELDDLVAATCSSALASAALVVCNPFPPDGVPEEVYGTVVAAARAGGVPVVVDLSSPRLDRAVAARPDLVKINDWELAEYVRGPIDGPRAIDAMRALQRAGARAVAVTSAEAPILVLDGDSEPFQVAPPAFDSGFREGCGDAMTGAVAAAIARGIPLRDALVIGAAAGAGNFLRHGLGTGRRSVVEELAARVTVGPVAAGRAQTAS